MKQLNNGKTNFRVFQRFPKIFLGCLKYSTNNRFKRQILEITNNAFYGLRGSLSEAKL